MDVRTGRFDRMNLSGQTVFTGAGVYFGPDRLKDAQGPCFMIQQSIIQSSQCSLNPHRETTQNTSLDLRSPRPDIACNVTAEARPRTLEAPPSHLAGEAFGRSLPSSAAHLLRNHQGQTPPPWQPVAAQPGYGPRPVWKCEHRHAMHLAAAPARVLP